MPDPQRPPNTLFLPTPGDVFELFSSYMPRSGKGDFSGFHAGLDHWHIWRGPKVTTECLYWGSQDWERPDLGHSRNGNPHIMSPDGVIWYKGDDQPVHKTDRTIGPYGEVSRFNLRNVRWGYIQYMSYVTFAPPDRDDPELPPYRPNNKEDPRNWDLTVLSDLVIGIRNAAGQVITMVTPDTVVNNRKLIRPGIRTLYIGSFDRTTDGWMVNTGYAAGAAQDMFTVARRFGITFREPSS